MNLTIEKIEEQFNLYFKGDKKIEAIKEWANKYDIYKEELVFSPNENKKELLKWIKILKNISREKTQKSDIEKLYKEFLTDFNKNKKEIPFKFKNLNNELDSPNSKNSRWKNFGIVWNLIKLLFKFF
ncbi:hypothetical protein OCK72_00410 [Fusobacterium simiae]|uniref:Uncharacterized protein n=1 Tax=Fusobacterium simiae TaxID=855 RepID=A0ABT4DET2_FUSSI|nr:hypothetical protein [Fusobacterium simiae]MCY7007106.1 hypothetical protein [Fusobacterium simiae]